MSWIDRERNDHDITIFIVEARGFWSQSDLSVLLEALGRANAGLGQRVSVQGRWVCLYDSISWK